MTGPYRDAESSTNPFADQVCDTHRFARTMHGVDAAFPRDPEYANPITYGGTTLLDRIVNVARWLIGTGIIVGFLGWIAAGMPTQW